jgi:Copper transport outer membrane protein, MctB
MVDFRYHVVSIVAVFLALTVGLVLGTTTLNGGVVHDLNGRVTTLISDKESLQNSYDAANATLDDTDAVLQRLGGPLVAGKLAGRTVTLVTMPDADTATVSGVASVLRAAGATVPYEVSLARSFLATTPSTSLQSLVDRFAPAGSDAQRQDTPADRAAAVLGAALVGAPAGGSGVAASDVLTAFAAAKLIDGAGDRPGDLLVLVADAPPTQGETDARNAMAVALLGAAAKSGAGAVAVGPVTAAGRGGVLAALRAQAGSVGASTVDGADRVAGQLTIVYALQAELLGRSGQWGSGPGNQGALPGNLPNLPDPLPTGGASAAPVPAR